MIEHRSHYEVLGIAPQASDEEVRAGYLEKIKRVHSDITGFKNDAEYLINFAYNVLKDPERRRQYDATLALIPNMERPRCPECKGTGKVSKQTGWTCREVKICGKCGGTGYETTK